MTRRILLQTTSCGGAIFSTSKPVARKRTKSVHSSVESALRRARGELGEPLDRNKCRALLESSPVDLERFLDEDGYGPGSLNFHTFQYGVAFLHWVEV